jgi:excisionase family DNA binding protein
MAEKKSKAEIPVGPYYSVRDAAGQLNLSVPKFIAACQEHGIEIAEFGSRSRRISAADLQRLVEACARRPESRS